MDWTALLDGPSIEDQQNLLAQKIKRAQELGAPQQHTTGIGTLLGGIGQILMGRKERDLRDQQMALAGQAGQMRRGFLGDYMQAQQGGGQSPAPEGPGGVPSFGSQPDPQRQQQLQMAGMLSGDPMIAQYVQHAPKMFEEQEKARKTQQENQALDSPEAGRAYRIFAQQMGINLPDGTPSATLRALMPTLEKMYAARESGSARRDSAAMMADYRKSAQQQRADQAREKRWTQFGQELDPARGRSGPLGKQLEQVAQIDRDLGLIQSNPNPTDQQIYELARGLDRAISGAAPTMGSTEHLVPSTLMGKIRSVQQYLSNKPTGADKQAFVAQMGETLQRLRDAGQGNIRQWQGKKASRYSDLAKEDQSRFESELQNWGLGADEFDPQSWVYKGKPKPPPSPPGAGAPDAAAELRKKYGL